MRLAIINSLMRGADAKYVENQNVMLALVNESQFDPLLRGLWFLHFDWHTEVLENRKNNPTDKNDLLNVMLTGKDKETGLGLSDDNIKRNVGL